VVTYALLASKLHYSSNMPQNILAWIV